MIDTEKLTKWSKEIYDIATSHGWHEEQHSPEHYLGLVMTEVAEAVEADRNNRYCGKVDVEMLAYAKHFDVWYRSCVKSSVEEEMADIVIRLLDMAYEIYGNVDFGLFLNKNVYDFHASKSFVENAWIFVRYSLGVSVVDIVGSIEFICNWADYLCIDIDQHIEWKMKYNSLRPYKHGGKKY